MSKTIWHLFFSHYTNNYLVFVGNGAMVTYMKDNFHEKDYENLKCGESVLVWADVGSFKIVKVKFP